MKEISREKEINEGECKVVVRVERKKWRLMYEVCCFNFIVF